MNFYLSCYFLGGEDVKKDKTVVCFNFTLL